MVLLYRAVCGHFEKTGRRIKIVLAITEEENKGEGEEQKGGKEKIFLPKNA